MKWITTFIVALAIVMASMSPGHAIMRKDRVLFKGKIVDVNKKNNTLVIYDYRHKINRTLTGTPQQVGAYTEGSEVVVNFEPKSNVIKSIRHPKK